MRRVLGLALGPLLALTAFYVLVVRRRSEHECNPFRGPGFLDLDETDWVLTQWQPLSACPTSHLWLDFVFAVEERNGTDAPALFPWLVGRTVVLIGDSIERFYVLDFCTALGETVEIFLPNTTYAVPDWSSPDDPLRANGTAESPRDARARRCRVEALDFEIVQFFHYGVATAKEFADYDLELPRKEHFHGPASVIDRIDRLVLPTLAKLKREPSLVVFGSSLWDVRFSESAERRFALPDDDPAPFNAFKMLNPGLSPLWTTVAERLQWYEARLEAALDHLELSFPRVQLLWRSTHDASWWSAFPLAVERDAAFRQVSDLALARRPRWRIDNWANLIRGHQRLYRDPIHPSAQLQGVRTDVLLYELARLYRSSSSPVIPS